MAALPNTIRNQWREIVKNIATEFVKSLKGRFNKHVSDEFILAYIDLYFPYEQVPKIVSKGGNQSELAYVCAQALFENLLESRCQTGGNGHHTAQEFAKLFENSPLKIPQPTES